MTKRKKRRPLRGMVMLAAAVALLGALSAMAVSANWLGLRDVLLDRKQPIGTVDEEGIYHPEETQYVDMISSAGYADSVETRALNQWTDFLNGYDVQGAANASDDYYRTHGEWPVKDMEKYDAYLVCDQTMADKLEEIVARYGLALVGQWHEIASQAELDARLGGRFLQEGTAYWGYVYDCGALQFEGDLPRGQDRAVEFQLHRAVKGYFDSGMLNIGDAGDYTQWEYTTACGERVLLCLGPTKGLIFADFDDCFVTVNVLSGTEDDFMDRGGAIDREDLEALADDMDFTLLHPAVPYAQTTGAGENGGAAEYHIPSYTTQTGLALPGQLRDVLLGKTAFYFTDALTDTREDMTLEEYCRWRTPAGEEPVELYEFAQVDLDGDEVGEIVLWEKQGNDLYHGYLILRAVGDGVYGYRVSSREMEELKADGTYSYFIEGELCVGHMVFESNYGMDYCWTEMDIGHRTVIDRTSGEEMEVWLVYYSQVTEAEYQGAMEIWSWKPALVNYTFSQLWREQNVKEVFGAED